MKHSLAALYGSMFYRSFHAATALCQRHSHYDALKVHRNADKAAIKKQYYRLSKQYHPDLHPNNPEAHAKFLQINEAYAVLGNEAKRRQYDSELDYRPNTSSVAARTGPSAAWRGRYQRPRNTGSASARAQAEGMRSKTNPFNVGEHYARHYEHEEQRRRERMSNAAERRRAAGHYSDGGPHHPSQLDTWWSRLWRLGVVLIGITYVTHKYHSVKEKETA